MSTTIDQVPATQSGLVPPPLSPDFEMDQAAIRKYTRKPLPELVFEFTRDPAYLHQYYEIRKNEYNEVYGRLFSVHSQFSADGDSEQDRDGHILIIRAGNFCVGGARINVKTPRKRDLLPVEVGDFRIEKYFPLLGHKQMSYGQVSGFAVLPEFRGREITQKMFQHLYRKCEALNVDVLFGDTSPIHARFYQANCAVMGLETKIHNDIRIPDPEVHQILFSILIRRSLDYSFFMPSEENNKPREVAVNNSAAELV